MVARPLGEDAPGRQDDGPVGRHIFQRLGLGHVAREHLLQRREAIAFRIDLVPKFAIVPPVDRHGDGGILAARDRRRGDDGHLRVGRAGLEAVDGAVAPLRGEDQQIARTIDRQIDGVERGIAHDFQPARFGPAPDALELPIDEIEPPVRVDRPAADGMEISGEFFDRTAEARGCHRIGRGLDVEHGELALAHVQPVGHVANGVGIGKFGDAQEGRAAIFVAGAKAAFAVHMDVAKANVADIVEGDGCGRGLARARDAIAVEVGDQDIVGIANLQRGRVAAFAPLSFGLRRQQFPVGDAVERDFAADMMLDRRLDDAAWSLRVGNQDAGMREGAGAPDIGEGAAAALRHPEAGILPVPAPRGIRIARGVVVVGDDARAVEQVGAVPTLELDVVDHRLGARFPEQRRRSLVGAIAVDADALDDRIAALRAFHHRLGRAHALKGGRSIGQDDLRQAGVKAHQHAVGPQPQRVADPVETGRQIDGAMRVDRLLQGGGVVRPVVAFRTQSADADPVADRRQGADRRSGSGRQGADGRGLQVGPVAPHAARAGQRQPIGEAVHLIGCALAGDGAAAFPEAGEDGHVGRHDILEADLSIDILLVRDDDAGFRYIFEAHVLAPQPVAIALVDLDPHGRVADRHVDHGEPGFMFANGCVALPLETGIDQGEGPGGGGFFRQYAVAAAVEMQVFGFVRDMIEPGQARSDVEIGMGDIAVLGRMETDGGGRRIAVQNAEIDIGQRRIEGAGIGVGDVLVERDAAGGRKGGGRRALVGLALAAGEHQHMGDAALETGRVRAEQDHRPLCADAEQAHPRPQEQRAADAVGSGGQEDDAAAAGRRGLIDRLLDRGAVIGAAVAHALHRHGAGLVGGGHIDGWRRQRRLRARQAQQHRCAGSTQSVFHHALSTGKNMSRPCRTGTRWVGDG